MSKKILKTIFKNYCIFHKMNYCMNKWLKCILNKIKNIFNNQNIFYLFMKMFMKYENKFEFYFKYEIKIHN